MARAKRRKRQDESHFDPVLSRGIIAVLLIVLAILIVLSFLGKAGTLGVIIDEWILSFLFGSIRYITPIVLVVIAGYILKDDDCEYKSTHIIGAILFYVAFTGLIHLRFDVSDMWRQALEGHGGGVVGMIAWPLKTYVGTIGSIVILGGTILIASLLLFNRIIGYIHTIYERSLAEVGALKDKMSDGENMAEEEEEDDYDEEDEYEDDEDEEDEEDERFTATDMDVDDEEEDYDEDYVDDEEEETVSSASTAKPKAHIPVDSIWSKPPRIKPLPKLRLLTSKKGKPTSGDIKQSQKIIKDTFKEFRIEVAMHDVQVGPTVTQYSLKPAKGVKISRITSLTNDLALALAAHPIRIEAPIPGKSLVGIEVPNEKTAMVTMRELLENKAYLGRDHDMMIALGKDVAGKVWFADLPRMPHLLIAGATGSGKTVCMHTIITSLLFQNTAETLRMIMVDPKRVELTLYNGIPHLLAPVITNTKKTINALNWTISEMDRRFEVLQHASCRDIASYNKKYPNNKLPYIIFCIDELADLMATAANEVEAGIIRLAQLARAVGIHLIVATQRPSVDVITGLMKANIPGRISFSVASLTDSRTILDSGGAEKLLGRGDMLHLTAALSKPVRIQGAFLSDEEVRSVVAYLKEGGGEDAPSIITEPGAGGAGNMFGGGDDTDEKFGDAKQAVVEAGKASASFLQRKLKIGYARAARILDELEAAGIIGPSNGSKPREILITFDELHSAGANSTGAGQAANVYTPEEVPAEEEEELEMDEEEGDYDDEEEFDDSESEEEEEDDYDEEDEYEDDEDEEDEDPEDEHIDEEEFEDDDELEDEEEELDDEELEDDEFEEEEDEDDEDKDFFY